ncbi:MAG TPA: FkbM family methyltransferase [Patescibacteria group bacterium]
MTRLLIRLLSHLSIPLLQPFFETIFFFSLVGMNKASTGAANSSGEKNVLTFLKQENIFANKPIIFDVGAHTGQNIEQVINVFPSAKIVAFEPSKTSFAVLQKKYKRNKEVQLVMKGLSSKKQTHKLFANKAGSGLASLYERDLSHTDLTFSHSEKIVLTTLDSFCAEYMIEKIDFLRMDIEGHELMALQGAKKMLAKRSIKAIQFEFGGTNIDSRTYFKDFFQLLNENYQIYRILHNGFWPIKEYKEIHEIFYNTNFLAVMRDK